VGLWPNGLNLRGKGEPGAMGGNEGADLTGPSPKRVVSLLASATELVCALGAGHWLMGRSHECDHPSWVKRLPAVSRPTFDTAGSSREVDERVRTRLRAGQPLYEVDQAALMALAPDVLITQTHCEVCAVSPADLAHGAAPRWVGEQVVALRTGSLDDILTGFLDVARVLNLVSAGEALVSNLRRRMAGVADRTRSLSRPSVLCLEWIDPVFAMGNWGPELVELAGGTCSLGTPGVHSTAIAWDAVCEADPEVLVVAPCGFDVDRTAAEMHFLAERPGWAQLRAVRSSQVFIADGNIYFNRSGPSLFDTPWILAEMLHPERFAPDHRFSTWVRLLRPARRTG
jgi:iron complex transport system substrate-binding protein